MHFNTKQFSYKDKMFVAEASTLQFDPEKMDRIYPDACDEGFHLVSEKTGKVLLFVYEQAEKDAEGDVQAFVFVPDPYAVRKNPALAGVTLHILND